MNVWVKVLVAFAALSFAAPALLFGAEGDWKAALGAASFAAFVCFIGGIGWFHFRFPLPPPSPGESIGLFSQLRRLRQHYPGWPGILATGVAVAIPMLLLINLGIRLYDNVASR